MDDPLQVDKTGNIAPFEPANQIINKTAGRYGLRVPASGKPDSGSAGNALATK